MNDEAKRLVAAQAEDPANPPITVNDLLAIIGQKESMIFGLQAMARRLQARVQALEARTVELLATLEESAKGA